MLVHAHYMPTSRAWGSKTILILLNHLCVVNLRGFLHHWPPVTQLRFAIPETLTCSAMSLVLPLALLQYCISYEQAPHTNHKHLQLSID